MCLPPPRSRISKADERHPASSTVHMIFVAQGSESQGGLVRSGAKLMWIRAQLVLKFHRCAG